MDDMSFVVESMENSIRCQAVASSRRRARRHEEEEQEFLQKLKSASASKIEEQNLAMDMKGTDDALKRDDLMLMMMCM